MIIDTSEPGTCTGCGQTMYWRIEKSGKRNPYNAPEPCTTCTAANREMCPRCEGTGQIQISHFATCPKAGEFRRRKA